MRKSIIYSLALASVVLPAAARTQKVTTFRESKNGDCQAVLQVNTDDGSIIAGCRASSKSKDYEAYWMKSDKNGNRLCVEKSKRDDVTRAHYLQRNADGSSMAATYETSRNGVNQALLIMRDAAGAGMVIPQATESPLFQKTLSLDHEMRDYLQDLRRHLRRALIFDRDLDFLP